MTIMAAKTAVARRLDMSVSHLQKSTNETKQRRIAFVPAKTPAKADDDGFKYPETYFTDPEEVKKLVGWKGSQNRCLGLRNCGNTCYMNSVLQALTHSSGIANDALNDIHMSTCARRKASMFCGYCQLLTHVKSALTTPGKSEIAPEPILRQLKLIAKNMRFGRQEDSHEFLRQLVDSCVTGELPAHMTSNPKGPIVSPLVRSTTVMGQLFSGYLQSQVTCGSCGNISRTFDPYMDISLEIQDCQSLVGCLRRFTRPDSLAGPNAYKCGKCERRVSAKKQMVVHRCPPLLTIQLKRFSLFSFPHSGGAQKISKKVRFESSLDMAPFLSQPGDPLRYSLYAVIVHEGSSMGSGHYVCYAKAANGAWYLFNDSYVQQVSEQKVLNQSAYILMYESKDERCFYPSDFVDTTPLKSPTGVVRVTTPTCMSGGVTVINEERDEDSSVSSDGEEEEETEINDGLRPTMETLETTPKPVQKRTSALTSYMRKMTRAVVRAPERKVLRMLSCMRVIAKKAKLAERQKVAIETPEIEASNFVQAEKQTTENVTNKWGNIPVRTWDDSSIVESRAFKSIVADQTNAAEPGARAEYDVEYDAGKSMHNPRSETAAGKGLPESLKDGFNALVRGDMPRRSIGKGKGFRGGFGKGKGKGSFGKGKGRRY